MNNPLLDATNTYEDSDVKERVRPFITLFMLMSVDGKISTGPNDYDDFDADIPNIESAKLGLYQYYELEKETDYWSINSGKVFAKIGWNSKRLFEDKRKVCIAIFDNSHLTEQGIDNICECYEKVVILSKVPHECCNMTRDNLYFYSYYGASFNDIMEFLYTEFNVESATLQTGGTINSEFLREGLIDRVQVVICPLLVGGFATPTLIDGFYNTKHDKWEVVNVKQLEHNYVMLEYKRVP